jgi:hypothetical protein
LIQLPPVIVDALHVDDGVFLQGRFGRLFGRQVFDALDEPGGRQRHQGIEETDRQTRMFAEYPLENKVIFGVKIACHVSFVFDVEHAAKIGFLFKQSAVRRRKKFGVNEA